MRSKPRAPSVGWAAAGLVLALALPLPALGFDDLALPALRAADAEDPAYRGWGGDIAASPEGTRVFATGRYVEGANLIDFKTIALDAVTGDELWAARYDGPPGWEDWAIALAPSPDGKHVYVTGWSRDVLATDLATVAYDGATGEQEWVQRYHGVRDLASWTVGQDIGVSPDGALVYVTGLSLPPGIPINALAFDFTTFAYDAVTGDVVWMSTYNGTGNVEDWAYALALTPDGKHLVVTGRSYSGVSKKWDYATVSYDAHTGKEEWTARYDGPGGIPVSVPYGVTVEEWSNAVATSPDGTRAFVTGRSYDDASNYDFATLAYNVSSAHLDWAARYNGPGNLEDGAYALAVSPDATLLYVTGWSASSDPDVNFDYATVAYDTATGQEVWVARYHPGVLFDNLGLGVGVDPAGQRVFVTGWSQTDDADDTYATVAYDARTGAQLWEAHVAARLGNNFDFAGRSNGPGNNLDLAALSVAPDGARVYITGTSDGEAGDNDFLAVAYDAASGSTLWSTLSEHAVPGTPREPSTQPLQKSSDAPPPPAATPGFEVALAALALLGAAARRRPQR